MANPITPMGRSRSTDIFEIAREQDEQRRINEDNEHFNRTGENRRSAGTYDPLVDNDRYRDIANDGDSYDENNRTYTVYTSTGRGYAEDTPTEIIESPARPLITVATRPTIQRNRPVQSPQSKEREAYIEREKIKEEKKINEMIDESKNKFNKNIISGISLDD